MALPLPQRCTIYRTSTIISDDNFDTGVETWATVQSNVPCRVDFLMQFSSRQEVRTEEFFGRNAGFIFFERDVPVEQGDVITIQDPHYANQQFDVRYVDPAVGFAAVDHLEVVVARRGNLIDAI